MIPFKMNLTKGSNNSLNLIKSFIDSKSDNYLLSEWKHIMRQVKYVTNREKWLFSKPFIIIYGIIFYIFMITYILSNIFLEENNQIAITAMVLNGLLLLFEILKIMSYCQISIKRYSNIIQIIIVIVSIYPNLKMINSYLT